MEIRVVGSADMNSVFMSASYLIDGAVLVDIPGGVLRELRRLGTEPSGIYDVLITHTHADHTADFPLWILKHSKEGGRPGSVAVYTAPENRACLESLIAASCFSSLTEEKQAELMTWHTEETFAVGNLTVTRIPVCHGVLPGCCGFRVTDGNFTAGFTGDSCLCEGVRTLASGCDLLFCDCDLVDGNEKHMGIDDLLELKKEFPSLRIVATHLKDGTRSCLSELGETGIEIAADGALYGG